MEELIFKTVISFIMESEQQAILYLDALNSCDGLKESIKMLEKHNLIVDRTKNIVVISMALKEKESQQEELIKYLVDLFSCKAIGATYAFYIMYVGDYINPSFGTIRIKDQCETCKEVN